MWGFIQIKIQIVNGAKVVHTLLDKARLFLSELDRVARKTDPAGGSGRYHPVIVTGDFNTRPHSPVFRFLTTGHFRYAGLPNRSLENFARGKSQKLGNSLLPRHLGVMDCCQV